ncbi:NAD(P)-dependent oxidoreductase [Desulforhopalus vacuolatus]|uniref:NAD(P)-dependent oxidoreductase n=1 Tax=Desulforhopalus vacuolatus TaxID=40414 RepID=UPI00196375FD|nr:NAD(P)-dependent oxidoreductase [Desulforhopalus vacuolatus]MBM9519496.1 NAD(P)-dependent oxidoreductase [Desulforhopalus vacuolatus]
MKTIGFIGLGVMGRSMAANIKKAGYDLRISTRTKATAGELIAAGATWCDTVAGLASGCDAIITIVGYPQDVEEVYFGEGGLLESAAPNTILIDMTTSSPSLARRIYTAAKEKGIATLDAPVSGGDVGAKNGTLSIMIGGDTTSFKTALPLFESMGKNIVYQGKAGAGQHCKASNQIAIASIMMGVVEAIRYAEEAGLDPRTVLTSIESGAAGSWSLSNLAPRMLEGNFEPGFFVKHFLKDMKIALDSSEELGFNPQGLSLAQKLYQQIADAGDDDKGTQVLYKYY